MEIQKIKTQYERNLPHIQPIGAAFFVTFRLLGSIPNIKLLELKESFENKKLELERSGLPYIDALVHRERKKFFSKYDELLDKVIGGPTYLKQHEIAQLIKDEIHRFDGKLYDLTAYTIMSNHVHLLIDTGIQLPEKLN